MDKPAAYRLLSCCDPIEFGVDPTLVASNLRLTPTERWEQHRKAMELIEEMERSRRVRLGLDSSRTSR